MIQKFRRHLFLFQELVKRDFKKKYKGSVLGMAWSILSPLLMLLVMRLVFSQFFGRSVEHYTTYLFCGNLVFSYFNEACTQGMSTLRSNAHIFTMINIPKYLFLLAKNSQTFINFCLTLVVFFVFCLIDRISFGAHFLMLLYPIVLLLLFNLGMGLVLSALFVFFRDMQYLWAIMCQIIMYMSAIFYTTDGYSQLVQNIFMLNPVYAFISYFRSVVISGVIPSVGVHLLLAFYAALSLGVGSFIYKKYNHQFLYHV